MDYGFHLHNVVPILKINITLQKRKRKTINKPGFHFEDGTEGNETIIWLMMGPNEFSKLF